MPNAQCELSKTPGERSYLKCLSGDEFVKDVFLDSDTDIMVLCFVPSTREGEPLTIEEALATRDIVEKMEGTQRLMLHGRVNPNQKGDVEDMERLAKLGVVAFKTYTQWGPDGKGFFLTDDVGIAFIERARKVGVHNIAIHKGLPFGQKSYEHSTSRDIGPIAKRFPDVNFLIYHSGYVTSKDEGPVRSEAHRRHRCAGHLRAERRRQAEQQRVRRARLDVALPVDARPDCGRACDGQAVQVHRRGQRAVGHGLDLVRLAAGPDPGVPHVPDRGRACARSTATRR